MNRRSFLKRIAAVSMGAVVVPTIIKKLPLKPCQYRWALHKGSVSFHPNDAQRKMLTQIDIMAEYPVGTKYRAADGRIFRYIQVKMPAHKGEVIYAYRPKNFMRHTT